jgi:hypothetical protein
LLQQPAVLDGPHNLDFPINTEGIALLIDCFLVPLWPATRLDIVKTSAAPPQLESQHGHRRQHAATRRPRNTTKQTLEAMSVHGKLLLSANQGKTPGTILSTPENPRIRKITEFPVAYWTS